MDDRDAFEWMVRGLDRREWVMVVGLFKNDRTLAGIARDLRITPRKAALARDSALARIRRRIA